MISKVCFIGCLVLPAAFFCVSSPAQVTDYRRSSLYSVLIRHPEKRFGKDIDTVFAQIPVPEKFNDHGLKVRAINAPSNRTDLSEEDNTRETIEAFITKNDLPKRLVSKWFNRKQGRRGDGTFDMGLIIERGLYDADYFDVQSARLSIRGQSMLADAGEELIGNTYVLFNDIRYIDKEETASHVEMGLALAGAVASGVTGGLTSVAVAIGQNLAVNITDQIAGFKVSVTSYLYRLRWNEETAATFYHDYYISEPDPEKKAAFEREKGLFSLDYVGSQKVSTGNTTLGGVHSKNDMIRKVCERAIDKNIARLQRTYEEFRVKTPLFSTAPLSAKVGLKEDIDENSRFEVLEMVETDDGRTVYKRVGVIRPKKGRVWDNRFMAEFEEENAGSTLTATEFEVVSGSGFYEGMLIREI